MAPNKSDLRVAWLFNCIGTPQSLLYWNNILPAYLERFPDSWFYTARPPSQPIPKTNKQVECLGSLRVPLGRRRGSYDRQVVLAAPTVVNRIRSLRPDVIVIQEFLAYSAYMALSKWMLPNSKLLMLLESDPIRGIASRRKPWVRRFRRLVARRMDYFLTNNQAGQEYLNREIAIPNDRILAQPYLVSDMSNQAEPASTEDSISSLDHNGRLVFLYVGQLIERKGIDQLIQGIHSIPDSKRKEMLFLLVGDGPQREKLESLAAELGLLGTIRFEGPQPYNRLKAYYRVADVFVMPTLDDYRALVGFEALSHGLPLLHSTYDGAVGELVEEGVNGFRFDPYETQQLAEKLEWFHSHRDQLDAMGHASRRHAEQSFTVNIAINNLVRAIETCHGLPR